LNEVVEPTAMQDSPLLREGRGGALTAQPASDILYTERQPAREKIGRFRYR
jgi:hypothetical protein